MYTYTYKLISNDLYTYSYYLVCTLTDYVLLLSIDHPVIADHPIDNSVPLGRSATLTCKAIGVGTLEYSWERSSGSSNWTTVSNDNTTSYTTDTTLAIGQYMYRCRVSNDAGSVVSNNAIVNVYGEYCPNM